ncbi:hypothetical protein [Geomicrobium sediminis]|uniref:Fatty acid desaturase n=1 Tax=Geomicrobium sediminis TaxID=1347788 RepID=A0ABS2PCW5_9BACL|nr:hypothetical protein [Geomicrobium sediminis]MBM7633264.1 fatty acid desaturase [Geomicrobium sediminis]
MRSITITGTILIITGWFTLVEFDHLSEDERKQLLQKIKSNAWLVLLIALMPVGIILNVIGTWLLFPPLIITGATFIVLQGIIVSVLFMKRKRWKGILLLTVIGVLAIFMYLPLFIH